VGTYSKGKVMSPCMLVDSNMMNDMIAHAFGLYRHIRSVHGFRVPAQ
jgi:hypothetical protein